jgi:hypothetical protein
MTSDRAFIFWAVVALGGPILMLLTPPPISVLLFGLTLLYEPFAALGCWAVAAGMTVRRTGTPASRHNLFMLGNIFALGYLLFWFLLFALS